MNSWSSSQHQQGSRLPPIRRGTHWGTPEELPSTASISSGPLSTSPPTLKPLNNTLAPIGASTYGGQLGNTIDPIWPTVEDFLNWKEVKEPERGRTLGRWPDNEAGRNLSPRGPSPAASASSFGSGFSGASHPPRARDRSRRKMKRHMTHNDVIEGRRSLDVLQDQPRESRTLDSSFASLPDGLIEDRDMVPVETEGGGFFVPFSTEKGLVDSVWCCYLVHPGAKEPCRAEFESFAELKFHKRFNHPGASNRERKGGHSSPNRPRKRHRDGSH